MSIQEQMRRGTKAENDAFTGAEGETTFDTDNNRQINHDGSKAGGYAVPNHLDVLNQKLNSAVATGTDDLTITVEYSPESYVNFQRYIVKPVSNNTGPMTLNVNSLGAEDIKKHDGQGGFEDIVADEIVAGIPFEVIHDGTRFILVQNQAGSKLTRYVDFTTSTTFTKSNYPIIDDEIIVEVWGGGGGGAGNVGSTTKIGGCAGGYAKGLVDLTGVSTVAMTVASGGAASGGNPGNSGGFSAFGSYVAAFGGNGGRSGTDARGGWGYIGDITAQGSKGQVTTGATTALGGKGLNYDPIEPYAGQNPDRLAQGGSTISSGAGTAGFRGLIRVWY